MLTSYQGLGSPANYKRVHFIRPIFLAEAEPAYEVQARFDYDVGEANLTPVESFSLVGVWNTGPGSSDLVVVPRLSIQTSIDNCPDVSNPGQEDTDGDGIGDACDPA